MSLAVVVLPLVPVITTDPLVRSDVSLVRTLGSIALATSPGRVVPPPRLVARLSAPVALPARTAAVLRAALFWVRRVGGGGGAVGGAPRAPCSVAGRHGASNCRWAEPRLAPSS